MKKKLLPLIIFIIISFVFGSWSIEMTGSTPDTLEFYLIYFPLLLFLVLQFYFIFKIRKSSRNLIFYKLSSFFILPVTLMIFLFFSFGEKTNKICVKGDCENGYGHALYKKSERAFKNDKGQIEYYKPDFLGRNFFTNIVWYEKNPIEYIYRGKFRNGMFHGEEGQEFYFTYDYEENHRFDEEYKFIDGIYVTGGEWESGWLKSDAESFYSGHIEMNDEIYKMLLDYGLDEKDYFLVKTSTTNESQAIINEVPSTIKNDCNSSRLYGDIKICLPEIDGMEEAFSFPQVKNRKDLFGSFSDNNIILGLYLSDEDFTAIDNFESEPLDDFFKIYALKQVEGIKFEKSDFNGLIESSKGNYIDKSWDEIIEKVLSGTDDMSIGQPVRIEAYKPTEDVFTQVLLTKMISGEEEVIVVNTLNIVRLKSTVILYAYYKNYKSSKTLEQAKAKSDFFGYKLLEVNQLY